MLGVTQGDRTGRDHVPVRYWELEYTYSHDALNISTDDAGRRRGGVR
jgi:hypothetical protein